MRTRQMSPIFSSPSPPIPKSGALPSFSSFPRKREPRDFSRLFLGPRFRGDDEFYCPQSPSRARRRKGRVPSVKFAPLRIAIIGFFIFASFFIISAIGTILGIFLVVFARPQNLQQIET